MVKDTIRSIWTKEYALPKGLLHWGGTHAKFEGSLWKPSRDSTQPAHFSVTGQTYKPAKRARGGDIESGGCLHELLVQLRDAGVLTGNDIVLPELIKWHLFDVRGGPTHYIANAIYRYNQHLRLTGVRPLSRKSWLNPDSDDKKAFEHFKAGVLLGELPDDNIPEHLELPRAPSASEAYYLDPKQVEQRRIEWEKACDKVVEDTLTPWLQGRLPRLMEKFEHDMIRWFGADIVE